MYRSWSVLILMLLLFSSCLKTREVEAPLIGSSDWISPTDYTILLSNMQTAISQQNVQNYLRCFSQDSFKFVPAAPVFANNSILWKTWSLQDEQNWFNNVIQDLGISSGNQLVFDEDDIQSYSGDSLRYFGNYEMVMNHRDTALTVRFKGQLEYLLKVNEYNEWEIVRWIDYETSRDSSISRLKWTYVQ